jgi:hypothetical protein
LVEKNLVIESWIHVLISADEVDVLDENVTAVSFLDSTAVR